MSDWSHELAPVVKWALVVLLAAVVYYLFPPELWEWVKVQFEWAVHLIN
jgi:hypothetical protein